MDISFIIVNYNTRELLLKCVDSIYQTVSGLSFEIILVDNASSDGSAAAVRKRFPDVRVLENKDNKGFAKANNQGFDIMKGEYALLINSDARLTDGAVSELYDFMQSSPETGMACGQLLNPDDSRQNSIANFPTLFSLMMNETVLRILFPKRFPSKRVSYSRPIRVESCIGACMIVRKKAMKDVGWFDERYFFFFEETDWALQMKKKGWKVCFVPTAEIYHAQGKSAGSNAKSRIQFYRSRYTYIRKWHPKTQPLFMVVIFIRLLVNTASNGLALLFTAGLVERIRDKFLIYLKLLTWHLKGCP